MDNRIDIVRRTFGLSQDRDVAELLGVIPQAVSAWRRKGIPPGRCYQLIELARQRRVELPDEFFAPTNGSASSGPPRPEKRAGYHDQSRAVES